ncbi:MAG: energy transducer TonB [Methylococcaceae bacterium]
MFPKVHHFAFVATQKQVYFPDVPQVKTTSYSKNTIHVFSILVAFALHIILLLALGNTTLEPEKLTQPKPIMVNWFSPAQEKKAVVQPKVEPAKPVEKPKKVEKAKPKTVTQVKPKVQPVKTKPLMSSQYESKTLVVAQTKQVTQPPVKMTESVTPPQQNTTPSSSSPSQSSETKSEPIVLPNLNADYLKNPAPVYPALARQNGEQGKVLVRVFVNENGKAEKVTLKKSSGYEQLDDSALETVKNWQFVPAHRGAEAVSAWVVVPISFSLEG